MYLLNEDEWPHPVVAKCSGAVTLDEDAVLQAYLVLDGATEIKTGGMPGLQYLINRPEITGKLASLADICEIDMMPEAL